MARSIRQLAGALPADRSSFVGRVGELADLKRQLREDRMVTLVGVGGVGKTRLALRAAAELQAQYPDGAWFVDLSASRDAELLPHAVALALPLKDHTTRPMAEVLASYLAERRLLLVLDTCEVQVQACAELVGGLLRAAPGLTVLATSRQSLGLLAERVVAVRPLPVRDAGGVSDAVALFVERATAAAHEFALTASSEPVVTALCQRLDGLPLSIELAAARIRVLSVEQILAHLNDRFALLTTGYRGAPSRHETLRAAIGWSHELCEPDERLLWARLAVFPADFDLAAVEEVCTDRRLSADRVFEVFAGLVDKSILLAEPAGSGPIRFRLLDTMREYSQEWLDRLGEQDTIQRAHRDYYLRLAKRFEAEWCGPDQVAWSERLAAEQANVRSALDFCLSDPAEHQAGLELCNALEFFWVACGFTREGRHHLERALALNPAPGAALAKAQRVCAHVAVLQGDPTAAEARLAQCRPYAEAHDDLTALGYIAQLSSLAAILRGDLARRLELSERAAELHRRGGDPMGLIIILTGQCRTFALMGESERAIAAADEARKLCDRYGERWMRSHMNWALALVELDRGNTAAAVTYARDGVRFLRLLDDSVGSALALDALAVATAAAGEAERAARLLGIAQQVWHTFGGLPQLGSPPLVAFRQSSERQARDALGDQLYEAAFAEGLAHDTDSGIAYALGDE